MTNQPEFEELLKACRNLIYAYHASAETIEISEAFEEAFVELEKLVEKYEPLNLPEEPKHGPDMPA